MTTTRHAMASRRRQVSRMTGASSCPRCGDGLLAIYTYQGARGMQYSHRQTCDGCDLEIWTRPPAAAEGR